MAAAVRAAGPVRTRFAAVRSRRQAGRINRHDRWYGGSTGRAWRTGSARRMVELAALLPGGWALVVLDARGDADHRGWCVRHQPAHFSAADQCGILAGLPVLRDGP